MEIVQLTVLAAAVMLVGGSYVRWIAERLDHPRGRLAPDRNMAVVLAPITFGGVAVALAYWSLEAGGTFVLAAFAARLLANKLVRAVRWHRRRRPSTPRERERRIEERAARRRARAVAIERYGPRAQGSPDRPS